MADLGKAYVQIIPSAKGIKGNIEKELNNEMDDAGKKAGDFFSSGFGKVMATGGKVALAASAAIATGIALITKEAVTKYAEYEQLVGGAKKIFDEMDYSKIANDAANAYKELNMSASEYIESINLAGSTFASTMGDEKGYDVARQGMKAIADYASGTGKNISELNQKYQMITRSTSSYQSIADQFAGILPQTSADFLEQAQAAGLLSEEYTQLTQVPVAEYQQAVTAMLEKGVAQMGLADNAMNESFSTLSGSLNMTKAAWDNLLVGIADPEANLGQLISNLVESATAAVNNLLPVVQQALVGVVQFVGEIIPPIIDMLPGLLEQLVPVALNAFGNVMGALFGALPQLLEVALGAIMMIANGLTTNLPTIIPYVVDIILQIANTLMANLGDLLIAAVEIILAIIQGLTNATPILLAQAPTIIQNLSDSIIKAAPLLLSATVQIINIMVSGIIQNLPQLITASVQIMTTLVNGIIANLPVLIQAAGQCISSFSDSFGEIDWGTLGTNIINGIVSGISSSASAIATAARNAAKAALDSAKSLLGIKSPSRVFRDQVGAMIGEGMALGIEDSEGAVNKALAELSNDTTAQAQVTVAANARNGLAPAYSEAYAYQTQLAGAGGDIVIPVYIGQRKIEQIVVNAINKNNYKSGGR